MVKIVETILGTIVMILTLSITSGISTLLVVGDFLLGFVHVLIVTSIIAFLIIGGSIACALLMSE